MAYYHFAAFFPNALFIIPCDHAADEDAQAPLPQPAQAAPTSALARSQASPSPACASPPNDCGNSACKLICLCENTPSTAPTKPTWIPLSRKSAASIPSTCWDIAPSSSASSSSLSSSDNGEDGDTYDNSQLEAGLASASSSSSSSSSDDNDEHDNSQSEEESPPASRPSTPGSPVHLSPTNLSNYSNLSNHQGFHSPLPSHRPPPASTRAKTLMQDMGLRVQTQPVEEVESLHTGKEEEELTREVKVYPPLAWRNGRYARGPRPERARVVGYCVVYEE